MGGPLRPNNVSTVGCPPKIYFIHVYIRILHQIRYARWWKICMFRETWHSSFHCASSPGMSVCGTMERFRNANSHMYNSKLKLTFKYIRAVEWIYIVFAHLESGAPCQSRVWMERHSFDWGVDTILRSKPRVKIARTQKDSILLNPITLKARTNRIIIWI